MSSDEDAITRCQRGDIEGLAELIRRHQADALRLAYLLTGDRYLAEDIVHDSFLYAYAAMPRFRVGRPFRPWFHQIVTNTTRKPVRSAARRRETSITRLAGDEVTGTSVLPDSENADGNPVAHGRCCPCGSHIPRCSIQCGTARAFST